MGRAGLTPEILVATAAAIVDAGGVGSLSMAGLAAEVGVRTPSLYNHVEGIDDLLRRIGLHALRDLAEPCRDALIGRGGIDALEAFAHAYRAWARGHPGTYPLTQVARPGDGEWEEAAARLLDPVLAVIEGLGLGAESAIHAARALRAAVHGFVGLEASGGFGLSLPPDASFDWMIRALLGGIGDGAHIGFGSPANG